MRFHQLHEWFLSDLGQRQLPNGAAKAGLEQLRQAQKFYAGDAAMLPAVSFEDFPRLPYSVTAVEFEITEGPDFRRSLILIAEEGPDDAWVVSCFQKQHQIQQWLHVGAIGGKRGAAHLDVAVNGLTQWLLYVRRDAESLKVMQAALQEQVHALGRFLLVLNCKNVENELIAPSAALNAKRLRHGKPPTYSYKVLVLKRSGARLANCGGTHSGPRVHLRRGHFKKRTTGMFWWQPHAVGDRRRGVVMKSYDASRLTEHASGAL